MKRFTFLAFLAIFLITALASPALAADVTGERTLNTTSLKAGESFRVTLNITVSGGTLYAPGIDENFPEGWIVTEVQNDGMIYQAANTQWVLVDEMGPGTKTVIYDVSVPTTAETGTYSITGEVSGKEWAAEEEIKRKNNITGDTNVTVGVSDIHIYPVADFTANITSGSVPLSVNFTDQSTGTPTSWAWDFNNDGTVDSTEQNPIYAYADVGNYTVNLTVTNAVGSNSTVKMNYITVSDSSQSTEPAPIAAFTADVTSGIAPLTVNFIDQSIGTPTSWFWDFENDGIVDSMEQNVSHTYTSTGNYIVNLTVGNANGINSTSTSINVSEKPVTVLPVANFSTNISEGYAPLSVQFTDLSENAAEWNWNFGDGTSSTEQNPVHTYSKKGKYTVKLTVENAAGSNTTTKSKYINVVALKAPTATFSASPTSGKAPLTVTFTDKSKGLPISWEWSFGDGTSSIEQNPVHIYNEAGKYTVSLTVKNSAGSSTTSKSSYINVVNDLKAPTAVFSASPTSGYAPLQVTFTDKSKGSPTSWKWNFGDGSSSTEQNPVHIYNKAGKYTVNLTVKNSAGSSTTSKSNYINVSNPLKAPTAAFSGSPTSGKAPLTVTFTDKSKDSPTSWKWNFGDGNTSTEQNPVHTVKQENILSS